jgi:hypothetical protein
VDRDALIRSTQGVTDSTREMMQMKTVLVVGESRALVRAVQDSLRKLRCADVVVTCAMREVQTRAAELRPFAIVMHEDMYAFDSAEFDALARDVRAALIVVREESRRAGIARDMDQQLAEAFSQRRP